MGGVLKINYSPVLGLNYSNTRWGCPTYMIQCSPQHVTQHVWGASHRAEKPVLSGENEGNWSKKKRKGKKNPEMGETKYVHLCPHCGVVGDRERPREVRRVDPERHFAWGRGPGMTTDCKRQLADFCDKHAPSCQRRRRRKRGNARHTACLGAGIQLNKNRNVVQIKPKSRIPCCAWSM